MTCFIPIDTESERAFEESYISSIRVSPGYPMSINQVAEKWNKLIVDLESGYKLGFDDYRNALYFRYFLEQVQNLGPESIMAKLRPFLRERDERFLKETMPSKKPLVTNKEGFWWSRIPINRPNKSDMEDLLIGLGYL